MDLFHSVSRTMMVWGFASLLQTGVLADEVTLNINARWLKTAEGQLMPTNGLVLLVASTNDAVFSGPTTNAFTSGDDIVLIRGDLSGTRTAGWFTGATNNLVVNIGGLNSGAPLALYWFPTMTTASVAPTNGTPYGFYRDEVGVDTSVSWVIPPPANNVSLRFKTADAGSSVNSTNSGSALWATGSVFSQNKEVFISPTSANLTITFFGIPGHQYTIERSTNLVTGLGWVPISTNILTISGVFQVSDSFNDLGITAPPIPSSAFYRLRYNAP
jgi:hypothetical protein